MDQYTVMGEPEFEVQPPRKKPNYSELNAEYLAAWPGLLDNVDKYDQEAKNRTTR